MKRLLFSILFVTITLFGCTYTPKEIQEKTFYVGSCDSLLASYLHRYLDHPITSDLIISTVEAQVGIQSEDVMMGKFESKDRSFYEFRWDIEGITHRATIESGNLRDMWVVGEEKKISVGKLVECAGGPPEWYRAVYFQNAEHSELFYYSVELWFPSVGMISEGRGTVSDITQLPVLTPEWAEDEDISIYIFSPGSVDDFSKRPERAYWTLELPHELQPWPGDWAEIRFVQK